MRSHNAFKEDSPSHVCQCILANVLATHLSCAFYPNSNIESKYTGLQAQEFIDGALKQSVHGLLLHTHPCAHSLTSASLWDDPAVCHADTCTQHTTLNRLWDHPQQTVGPPATDCGADSAVHFRAVLGFSAVHAGGDFRKAGVEMSINEGKKPPKGALLVSWSKRINYVSVCTMPPDSSHHRGWRAKSRCWAVLRRCACSLD